MKRLGLTGFSGVLILLLAVSCSKGGAGSADTGGPHVVSPDDVTAPVLDIYTPAADQAFASGSTIQVTGKITDDLGLYRGSIRITNDATGELVKQQLYEIHGFLAYNFNISHAQVVTTTSNFTVTVTFEDHGLNSTTKSVKIKVNP